jgi:hypothetical protein
MTLRFNYKTIDRPLLGTIKSPSISVSVSDIASNIPFNMLALVDSGADISAIGKDVASMLNLDMNGPESVAIGIGGNVKSKESVMNLKIGNDREKYNIRIPVKILLEKNDFGIILGRRGFFDKFRIEFDQYNEKMTFKRNNSH